MQSRLPRPSEAMFLGHLIFQYCRSFSRLECQLDRHRVGLDSLKWLSSRRARNVAWFGAVADLVQKRQFCQEMYDICALASPCEAKGSLGR